MPRFETSDVRSYYDRHTPAFVALGEGGASIHRAVWGPGVDTHEQAFRFVEDRIAELVIGALSRASTSESRGSLAPHIMDLGCGVAAGLCHLATRLPLARGTGLTLSPVQVRLAAERIQALGLSDRVTCIEADYCDIPAESRSVDVAYAIESFVHGPSPARFFTEAARVIGGGGLLIVCDDIKRPSADLAAARTLDRFARGWHVNTLVTQDELRALAADAGFDHVETTDLTPWLELGRWRDRAIDVMGFLVGWLPLGNSRAASLLGGAALQKALGRGWLGYDLTVFRRR
jgi:SAM-dependent methyltransferase